MRKKRDRAHTGIKAKVDELMALAEKAPPAHRSKLGPYIGVLLTLRAKDYSYEGIADFLTKHTGEQFTRSQVFAFMKRNSNLLGVVDQRAEETEGEAMGSQLVLDHAREWVKSVPGGKKRRAVFLHGDQVKDPPEDPGEGPSDPYEEVAFYRIREKGTIAEVWNGRSWVSVNEDSIRDLRVDRQIRELEGEGDGHGD